jgi:hypothetical protein
MVSICSVESSGAAYQYLDLTTRRGAAALPRNLVVAALAETVLVVQPGQVRNVRTCFLSIDVDEPRFLHGYLLTSD